MTTLESKLVSIERRLEELEETMEILGDKKTTKSIARGLNDLKEGSFRTYRDVGSLIMISTEVNSQPMTRAFCVKEKKTREIAHPKAVTFKNGREARGECSYCGTTLFRITGK